MWRQMLLLLIALLPPAIGAQEAERVIRYMKHQGDDPHRPYMLDLLRLAAARSGQKIEIRPSDEAMNQGRALREITQRTGRVDLIWTMTSVERERELLPIRIPLFKGLIGWRIPLVKADSPNLLQNLKSGEIAALTAGQMQDWPDTEILRANGFKVAISAQYASLFSMLARGRIDYFPRSAIEIWQELADHKNMAIAAEASTVIYYPTAYYFFVGRHEKELASALERGLEAAIRDGSFDKVFWTYNKESIQRARLDQRRQIVLDNPYLPPETPLKRSELWYQPRKGNMPANDQRQP